MLFRSKRWADVADKGRIGDNTAAKIGGLMSNLPGVFGSIGGALASAGKGWQQVNPYAGTRAQNIENAKAAGEFDAIKDAYNRDAVGSGYRMDDNGTINRIGGMSESRPGISNFAAETLGDQLDAMKLQRDFARGESPVQKMADGTLVKANPYGTATAGGPGNFGMGEATMKDHMGRTVPINPYLAEQAKVQASKFGNMPTDRHGNAIENEEDNGEDDEEDDEEDGKEA